MAYSSIRMSFGSFAIGFSLFTLFLIAVGLVTRTPPSEAPIVSIAGSGFLFNYRIGEVRYGFTARINRPVKQYSKLIAHFEDPAGGPDLVTTEKLNVRTVRYAVASPPLRGVEKGKPYRVLVELRQNGDNAVLYRNTFTVTSQLSDNVVPTAPLTIGPGYARNPQMQDVKAQGAAQGAQ